MVWLMLTSYNIRKVNINKKEISAIYLQIYKKEISAIYLQ